eukprot:Opistho-2@90166
MAAAAQVRVYSRDHPLWRAQTGAPPFLSGMHVLAGTPLSLTDLSDACHDMITCRVGTNIDQEQSAMRFCDLLLEFGIPPQRFFDNNPNHGGQGPDNGPILDELRRGQAEINGRVNQIFNRLDQTDNLINTHISETHNLISEMNNRISETNNRISRRTIALTIALAHLQTAFRRNQRRATCERVPETRPTMLLSTGFQ